MSNPNRTSLLIRCSLEEAQLIRAAARRDRRTLSGYVLNCLHKRMSIEMEIEKKLALLAKPTQDQRSSSRD